MAQNFKLVGNAESVKADLQTINDNFEAVRSSHSGTSYPTQNLTVGMQFYNTSTGNTYVLKSINPVTWDIMLDRSSEIEYTKITRLGNNFYNDSNGNLNVIDQVKIDTAGACRSAFLPAAGIKVEYSIDGGATYLDYGLTDAQKQRICSMNRGIAVFVGKSGVQTVEKTTRITLSNVWEKYSSINQFYCLATDRDANCTVDIEVSRMASKDKFEMLKSRIKLNGWPGHNLINLQPFSWGGGADSYYAFRFTFRIVEISKNTEYVKSPPDIQDIRLYGQNAYSWDNQMMLNGCIYSWDEVQNVTFPAKVAATEFVGNASSASKLNGTIEPIVIDFNKDLNSIIDSGLYRCDTNDKVATLLNCPTRNAFSLFVCKTTNAGVHQALTEFLDTNPITYYRNKYNETWGKWYQNIDSNNISKHNVATAAKLTTSRTINGTPFDGSKDIEFGKLTSVFISANTDLDALTYPGMYCCLSNSTAATLINSPTKQAFSLLVERHAGTRQTLSEHNNNATAKTFFRNGYVTWSAWYRNIDSNNIASQNVATVGGKKADNTNGNLTVWPSDGKLTFPNGTQFWIE